MNRVRVHQESSSVFNNDHLSRSFGGEEIAPNAPDLYIFPSGSLAMIGREWMFDTGRLQYTNHYTYYELHFLSRLAPSQLKIGLLGLPLFYLAGFSITLIASFHFVHSLMRRAAQAQSNYRLMVWWDLWLGYMAIILGEIRSLAVRMAPIFTILIGTWVLLMQFVTRYLESSLTASISSWHPWKVLQSFDDMIDEPEFAQYKILIYKRNSNNRWMDNSNDPRIGKLR